MVNEDNFDWKFSQCFGESIPIEDLNEADIISAVQFDQSGCFLATGDKGGRVVLFELGGRNRVESIASAVSKERKPFEKPLEFSFKSEFQSHEPKFDYLKSLDIEEKINRIRWCHPSNNALFLLSTNDKTIKLWKVFEKDIKVVSNFNHPAASIDANHVEGSPTVVLNSKQINDRMLSQGDYNSLQQYSVPADTGITHTPRLEFFKLKNEKKVMSASSRRVYSNAHAYHINSVSVNSDGETFLSADDLRINLWNLEIQDSAYNIVDIKPPNMDDLSEVITAAEFHPLHCNLFMYSSSRGSIRLGDLRARALCDVHAKTYQISKNLSNKNYFSEIIASISDIKFSSDGRYMICRDYLTLNIWDVNMDSRPIKSINVHDHLRENLADLHDSECIFDKFELALSADGNQIATGSYNNSLHVFDKNGKMDLCIEAGQIPFKQRQLYEKEGISNFSGVIQSPQVKLSESDDIISNGKGGGPLNPKQFGIANEFLDYNRKLLYMSWHPNNNLIACAGLNNLYIYSK